MHRYPRWYLLPVRWIAAVVVVALVEVAVEVAAAAAAVEEGTQDIP